MTKKLSALFLALALVFSLAACGGGPAPSPSPSAEGRFTPGTYEGSSENGMDGTIKVAVTLSADKIEKVEVLEQNETAGIGATALEAEKLPQAVVDAQSTAIDNVSGATITTDAFIEAVNAALTAAGVDPASLVPAASGTDNEPSGEENLTADVVVVGAGGAGMAAALSAAEAGKSVIILEKMSMAGGNSVRSTGGMNAAKTEWQDQNEFHESAGVEKTLAAAEAYPDLSDLAATVKAQYDAYTANPTGYFDSVELFMLDTLIGGKDINNKDLVKTLAENSADAIAWLSTLGADLHNVGAFGGASVKRIHRPVNDEGKTLSVGAYLVPILEQACKDKGIQIIFDAPATEILMDGGKAVGVKAEGYTVSAGAVVIASGGFGANLDMVAQLKPELKGFVTTNAPGIQGDGIKMAEAVGAATVDMDQIQIHPTVEQKTSALITEGLRGDGAILVNAEGLRFCDEVGTRDAVSAAELAQTGGSAWLIVDQKMADASSVIAGYISKGYTVTGGTYDELAGAMGVPADALSATMEQWNAAVAAGKDDEFGRTSFAKPLDTAPYYAIQVAPGVHHTMGGVKIDASAQVIDTAGAVIPGLFAAGEVTGGIHGANRLGGNAVADFVIFGRIAGSSAAAYVK